VHCSFEDVEIHFVLKERVPLLFQHLRRHIGDQPGVINDESPHTRVEISKTRPSIGNNITCTGHVASIFTHNTIALFLGGGLLDVAKIDWKLKCLRLNLEVWWPILDIYSRELSGNFSSGPAT